MMHNRGFTLIELLIVIGILAILSTATVLVINPLEKLRQARDVQRLSDFKTVAYAINLYLATAGSDFSLNKDEDSCTAGSTGYPTWRASATGLTKDAQPFLNSGGDGGWTGAASIASDNVRLVTGFGWVPVDFTSLPTGSPIAKLPLDPLQ
mgnify:CR=1 FL=1